MSNSGTTSRLTPQSRAQSLDALRASADGEPFDVLVIGGGVTGAGIALDSVTRGLTTAIVEGQDWAAGTSSRSSKLVHGGLRYLQMLDFHLVHEALTERDLLITKLAPHLVKPVSFLYPLEHRIWERGYVGAGVMLYDTLASLAPGKRALPFHKHVTRKGMSRLFPDLRHDAAVGAVRYWDASVDDARLVSTLVRTAASYGAHAASRTQAVELTKDPSGRVDGAVLKDLETGEELRVKARNVINATGVWTEETEALAGGTGGLRVLASKGVHIVVPRERIRGTAGLILQTEKSVLFVIPWSRYWVIGTTDTPWTQELQHPVATAADIDYVLEHANAVLADPLTRDDIIGTWAGLRPLLQPGTKEGTSSAKVSREHTVASPTPGLTVIAGGKLTTYRVMAEDAVDFALGEGAKARPSITAKVPLLGAVGLDVQQNWGRRHAATYGWTPALVDHLLHRYGSLLSDIVELCETDPGMATPLEHAPAYLRAEIAYAVSHEGVLHLEDILLHRTRLNYEVADRGLGALEEISRIAADGLGWDEQTRLAEVAAYTERARAEEQAELAPDDASAEQARLSATDVAPLTELSGHVDGGLKPGSPTGSRGAAGPAGT
ncbi:glycerol-3-phosphate dehydrogenase/oxidase [Sanguibacter antarcticus]|uniref:Glycerol-3-phosphate dehydrogenase n=1 Tax=Sanguibacter antarcticus TaxID=372484 RepID=A0A2A9E5Q7_9MICO|nr:glycerol-3-phosphate dehydrogenase/oxidase [Sanguibacter antarcticus]PFG34184.1 glycerol-3-phosphate dehydrogenase [Sanguibacter antarcticus]